MSYVPTAAFRKNDISSEKVFYRLFVKRVNGKKFEWYGEFKSVEEAKDRFAGMFKERTGIPESKALYVIKKVVVSYDEETCDQSPIKTIEETLPELKGMF